ncbi:MAG: hypothetical protein R6V03_11350, partial [Kiritimatiellia bacterium]
WEPFIPIEKTEDGFETLKHRFTLAESGLPAQIYIKPDERDLPLENRGESAPPLSDAELTAMGRGPQLRRPIRLEVQAGGRKHEARPVSKAECTKQWKSEIEYTSRLKAGPLNIDLKTRYDCDGAMYVTLRYGGKRPVKVESFEMITDLAGPVDLKATSVYGGGMAGADTWECSLPRKSGVVWDSADMEYPDLYYTHFMPWLWFGSGDRAFTWFSDSDRGWVIDRDGTTMRLERDDKGRMRWYVTFVNHPAEVRGERRIDFTLLTHPSKPKPEDAREKSWFWRGGIWADEYFGGDFTKPDEELLAKARSMIRVCDQVPEEEVKKMTDEEVMQWYPKGPIYWRYYQNKGIGNVPRSRKWDMTEEEWDKFKWDAIKGRGGGVAKYFEDKIAFWFERHVRTGRRHGWWWDETWPVSRSTKIAEGHAYLRDPEDVRENELPWQDGFCTGHMRNAFKRLARIMKENNIPNRNYFWANNEGTCFESFGWDTAMVEECGGAHRTYEVDMIQQYPNSLYRRMAHNWTGLIARLMAQNSGVPPGDDPRMDRMPVGIALLHDFGVSMQGPHGQIQEKQQVIPLLNSLWEFGFFDDMGIEKIPFWRSGGVVDYGLGEEAGKAGDSVLDKLEGDLEITVYRRPLEDGRKGYKAILVMLNETDLAVEHPLRLSDVERILGGRNTLKAGKVREETEVPEELKPWWNSVAKRNADEPVLMDFETGDVVACADRDRQIYGPVYVPYHTFRILYAEHAE